MDIEEIKRIVESMKTLGTSEEEIKRTLREMGVPEDILEQIFEKKEERKEVQTEEKTEKLIKKVEAEEKLIKTEPEKPERKKQEIAIPEGAHDEIMRSLTEVLNELRELKALSKALQEILKQVLDVNRKILIELQERK